MDWEKRRVKFADKKQEENYKRLTESNQTEDKILYFVLRKIRKTVWEKHQTGKEIPKDNIPAIYKRMFHINNLWRLNLSDQEIVFYSIAGKEILIVDILWDRRNKE